MEILYYSEGLLIFVPAEISIIFQSFNFSKKLCSLNIFLNARKIKFSWTKQIKKNQLLFSKRQLNKKYLCSNYRELKTNILKIINKK